VDAISNSRIVVISPAARVCFIDMFTLLFIFIMCIVWDLSCFYKVWSGRQSLDL
jgi:hypothetical protein